MRRLGAILMVLALTGGLVACGADEDAGPPPVPDTFVVEGTSRLSDPFGDVELESWEFPYFAVLTGTEYAVALSRYAVATELNEEAIHELHLRGDTRNPPWRAGKGREFLLVHLIEPKDRKSPTSTRFPTAAVLVDGQARQLGETAVRPNAIIVVSVPTGADATLAVTEAGQTQSISLRTGKLVGPSPKPTTPKPTTPSPSSQPAVGPVLAGKARLADYVAVPGHGPGLGWDALIDVSIEVEVRPHDEERGQAPAGALWAHVEVKLSGNPTYVTFNIDLPRSLTIRTAGGQVLRIPAGTKMRMPNFLMVPGVVPDPTLTVPDTWSMLFQVPKKTRKLSVTYRTRGNAIDSKGKKVTFNRRESLNSGTITLK
ncbi:hypothetical protein I0C86_39560 [Plantactinospora sp. S1510]|uniref:Lipoprotein n=1 Tax=Plantactinospora alkalitolerans TaxID=2789879 RepID=A0ABS0H9Y6_9ACTN|nr:hypothetical protein [Plantactinospora alkalitolerans]MBF9134978.1 hypothetical protein [Plantactinospora alkalitolerans]